MDTIELAQVRAMQKYFTALLIPCPAHKADGLNCDGFLSEFDQEGTEPFKAFLYCPICESRLRLWKKE